MSGPGERVDETTFAKAFLRLLTKGHEPVLSKEYRPNASSLSKVPFTPLANMPVAKLKKSKVTADSKITATISLKSIRTPKFSTSVNNIPLTSTILSVKEALLSDKSLGLPAELTPASLKFLVKGKVVTDSKLVESVVSDDENGHKSASFTVMISTPSPVAEAEAEAEPEPSPESVPSYLQPAVWEPLVQELAKSISDSEAKELVAACQSMIKAKMGK